MAVGWVRGRGDRHEQRTRVPGSMHPTQQQDCAGTDPCTPKPQSWPAASAGSRLNPSQGPTALPSVPGVVSSSLEAGWSLLRRIPAPVLPLGRARLPLCFPGPLLSGAWGIMPWLAWRRQEEACFSPVTVPSRQREPLPALGDHPITRVPAVCGAPCRRGQHCPGVAGLRGR